MHHDTRAQLSPMQMCMMNDDRCSDASMCRLQMMTHRGAWRYVPRDFGQFFPECLAWLALTFELRMSATQNRYQIQETHLGVLGPPFNVEHHVTRPDCS